jgi:hypothetical protein
LQSENITDDSGHDEYDADRVHLKEFFPECRLCGLDMRWQIEEDDKNSSGDAANWEITIFP